MALNSDLASTMIELAGLTPPASHTGRSLAPLLRGTAPADWRQDFFCEFLAVPGTIPKWEGVRGEDWVYARYFVDGPAKPPFEFLHDLKKDPDQLVNVASLPNHLQTERHSVALVKMRARCDALIAENGLDIDDARELVQAEFAPAL